MTATMKRKLDGGGSNTGSGSGSGSGCSTPTTMSAFAARQQLWRAATNRVNADAEPAAENAPRAGSSKRPSTEQSEERKTPRAAESEQGGSGTTTPRPEPTATPARQHSSFRPSKKNFHRKAGGRVVLSTPEAERLVLLGSYGVKVSEGEATIASAIISPSDGVQWVHAPQCHAVPVLRTADSTVLELQPHPASKGLRQLAKLNPFFANIWSETDSQTSATGSSNKSPATFQMIYTSDDVPKKAVLQELVSPAEWNKKLSALATTARKGTPIIFLCGPKSSGKSTFGRLVANRFVTDRGGLKNKPWSSVMILDLDPGQPEYSPPGVVSLSKITAPNLAPSFCHPALPPAGGQVRAHAIASVTPALDPTHFVECAVNLYGQYKRSVDAKYPLIVNTPGWIQGTGLDILCELITAIRPTETIYMSRDGPDDTISTLQSACNATAANQIPVTTLPSQTSDICSRTSLHLRTMQTMSYFHLRQSEQLSPTPSWDPTPLTDLRPWRVRYSGPLNRRGFLGILCYDHEPAPSLLAEAINGTLLALVKLESRAALRGLTVPASPHAVSLSSSTTTTTEPDTDTTNNNPTAGDGNTQRQQDPKRQSRPTETTSLPLISNPHGLTLDPRHSHFLSIVLVRGVDTARHELQLLTPLPQSAVAGLKGEELVLVAGKFDTPTWAYSEGLYLQQSRQGSGSGVMRDSDDATSEDSNLASASDVGRWTTETGTPWVEVLHGSQKRDVGSEVWRVRRDLGKRSE